ncbi:hypothetical protein AAHC03_09502 [Spirometra sp. Aus1]
MNLRLANVDVIIELHDARLPFTGRCNFVKDVSQIRPRILIMNKCDLAEPISDISAFKNILRSRDLCSSYQQPPAEVFFTNMKSPERQKRLIRKILTSLARLSPNADSYVTSSSNEFSAIERDFEAGGDLTAAEVTTTGNGRAELMTMVVGLPNCGKSTFINALRSFAQPGRRRAVAVGKNAGRTRSVGSAIVLAPSFPIAATEGGAVARECCIRVIDTPGILEPRAQTLCGQLSLGVCGALDWDAVDKELLADYLLFCLNRRQRLEYVQVFDMPGPTSNVAELLAWISAHSGLFLRVSSRRTLGDHAAANNKTSLPQPDFTAAAHKFLRLFCEGHLGRLTFRPEDEEEASRFFVLAPGSSGAK